MQGKEIGSILLKNGRITKEQLDFCLMIQKQTKGSEKVGRILKYYNFITDDDIAKALANQVDWKYFNKEYVSHLPAIENIGLKFLRERVFIPVETPEGVVFVFAHPFDTEATDLLAEKGYQDKEFYIGSEGTIYYYLDLLINQKNREEIEKKIARISSEGLAGDELKELVKQLLDDAIAQNATDIHIEATERISTVRFRIDGILHHKICLPIEVHKNFINVIFSKADVTTSEFQKFHDARFQHEYLNHSVDIRLSCIPTEYGPAVVLRLLDITKTVIALEKLGFRREHLETIQRALEQPYGIIIVTGPTGSGKTTTLYAVLNSIKSLSTKIVTVEDPVEIKMPLLNQVQINEKQGVTFATATRAFLRHDPDIIFIGEIRDTETALEAIRASITGHRVFSTLHTNTATGSVYRLKDLGVDLEHIANSITCVVSQRLIRKLCGFCRRKTTVEIDKLPEIKQKYIISGKSVVFEARGCEKCQDGYCGRTIIAETLYFTEDIRMAIAQNRLVDLRLKIEDKDYITLQKDTARLVSEGITSLDEAVRVAG